ncbi:MAG: phenylalanine--tRNA ligase subunit beta, partial [Mariprofundaceae bacterium]
IQSDEWFDSARKADFFDLKGAVESWLAARGLVARFMADDDIEGLQAGQSAKLLVGRTEVGRIGKLDADIADGFDIEWPVFVAEINLDVLPKGKVPKFSALPEFPGVERDLVFLFDRAVQADDIIQAARKAGGKLLTGVRIFDLYQGQGVADDKVSLGIRFALQATDRTLAQDDSDAASGAIIAAMDKKFGANLRG